MMKAAVVMFTVAGLMIAAAAAGMHVHVIISGSMEPALNIGTLVVTADTSIKSVRKGDIVVCRRPGKSLSTTHRVIRKYEDHLITRGDANTAEDGPVYKSEVKEKVLFHVPLAGYVLAMVLMQRYNR